MEYLVIFILILVSLFLINRNIKRKQANADESKIQELQSTTQQHDVENRGIISSNDKAISDLNEELAFYKRFTDELEEDVIKLTSERNSAITRMTRYSQQLEEEKE